MMKEVFGKEKDWDQCDLGELLGAVKGSLRKFLPLECWAPSLAVRAPNLSGWVVL